MEFMIQINLEHDTIASRNKQINTCVILLQKTMTQYCLNLNVKNVADNKKHKFFSDKASCFEKVSLIEKDQVISNYSKIT